ncbi:unnamed protein product [Parascedosporium putredinis]|uniref:Uncharacterized protein n=1 Tax=Parascedosporium putredinis TaxID=1442378 RepID=A0A9P1H0C8_9PEZI|nr:unnamed protein product [Parascedosporium putredinis]CAI7993765.1 unnamed protein product [Parascedosporium putredinis]
MSFNTGVIRFVLAEIGGHRQLGGDVSIRRDGPHDRGIVKADLAVSGVADLEFHETLDLGSGEAQAHVIARQIDNGVFGTARSNKSGVYDLDFIHGRRSYRGCDGEAQECEQYSRMHCEDACEDGNKGWYFHELEIFCNEGEIHKIKGTKKGRGGSDEIKQLNNRSMGY